MATTLVLQFLQWKLPSDAVVVCAIVIIRDCVILLYSYELGLHLAIHTRHIFQMACMHTYTI